MSNNKWTKTATSASLAILGVTQLNNKANANIVQGGTASLSVSSLGYNHVAWSIDASTHNTNLGGRLQGYISPGDASVLFSRTANVSASSNQVRFLAAARTGVDVALFFGSHNTGGANLLRIPANTSQAQFVGSQHGYIMFKDIKTSPTSPTYGWARWEASGDTVSITQDYYENVPGQSLRVGQTSSTSTDIPFDFNPLQGAALGVPIFMGLRQLKRRKAKLNSIVSIKRKEKIHPLALLGMGAAGVRKWREQKDKDAA